MDSSQRRSGSASVCALVRGAVNPNAEMTMKRVAVGTFMASALAVGIFPNAAASLTLFAAQAGTLRAISCRFLYVPFAVT